MEKIMRRFEIIGNQNDRDRLEKIVIEKGLTHDDLELVLKVLKIVSDT